MWCCPGKYKGRAEYYQGKRDAFTRKFHLTPGQKKSVIELIQRDTAWLKKAGLMDYSLLVGIQECAVEDYRSAAKEQGKEEEGEKKKEHSGPPT